MSFLTAAYGPKPDTRNVGLRVRVREESGHGSATTRYRLMTHGLNTAKAVQRLTGARALRSGSLEIIMRPVNG